MSSLVNNIRISISIDFLKAFAQIPSGQQKKIREFVQLFQNNPTLPSINYEPIKGAYDSNLHSVRIDKEYRAIIAKPALGSVYILLWVAKHDDAYAWATKKRLQINPVTGALQIMEIDMVESDKNQMKAIGMFDQFSDEQLLNLGIPQPCLPQIRNIHTEDELYKQEDKLPVESYNSLFMLACGESYEALLEEYSRNVKKAVDTNDFSLALDNNDSQCRFKVIEDSLDLEALLNSPLEQWRVFLHPTQRRMAEHSFTGPARIMGGAGTGKTVVIVHRAKFLAQQCPSEEKILVTTFSTTLADDIRKRLRSICSQEELAKIDVTTVDSMAAKLATKKGIHIRYNTPGKAGTPGDLEKLWQEAVKVSGQALKYDAEFYMAEWQDVIQAQQIDSLDGYLAAQRGSRGKRLDKNSREKIWYVLEQYRLLCEKYHCADIDFTENKIAGYCAEDPAFAAFLKYRSIMVDECQDLRAPAYRMIRAIAGPQHPDDLLFVGDSRQRIYHGQASLSQCGIIVNNRSYMLKLNYRTTAEIYEAALRVQRGFRYDDLDGSALEQDRCVCIFHGEKPVVQGFDSLDKEIDAVAEDIKKRIADGVPANEICVLNRINKWCYGSEKGLNERGIDTLILSKNQVDDPAVPGIRIATMHRVKGMEFSYVYIIGASSDNLPLKEQYNHADTEEDKQELMQQEANLLSVAMTRAKKLVWITYEKKPSVLLEQI